MAKRVDENQKWTYTRASKKTGDKILQLQMIYFPYISYNFEQGDSNGGIFVRMRQKSVSKDLVLFVGVFSYIRDV